MKKPVEKKDADGNITRYCSLCAKYLPEAQFYTSTIQKKGKRCKTCMIKTNVARRKRTHNRYRIMLRYLRDAEKKKNGEKVSMNIEERDIRYVVKDVWHNQSAISSDDSHLSLIRWDKDEPLTPWNCVLVTKREAREHNRAKRPMKLYSEDQISNIQSKLQIVKNELFKPVRMFFAPFE